MNIIIIFASLISAFCVDRCSTAPARTSKNIQFFSTRANPPYILYHYGPPTESRGPFDFIGNWIQSSDWFPIEINVPDTISSIGNGIGSFAQNVGSGFQSFTQNVGSGFQSFTQDLTQRFPVLAVFVRPNSPPRYFVLLPTQNMKNTINKNKHDNKNDLSFNPFSSELLDSFP